MDTHISRQAIHKLSHRILTMKYHYGVPTDQINIDTPIADIRKILGNHDVTGRLAAQIRQALLQGAI